MNVKKQFSLDVVIYGLGMGLRKFIGLFLLPFYTRALPLDEYGVLDSLTTFLLLLTVCLNLGLDSSSAFYFFQAKEEHEKGRVLFTHFILKLLAAIPAIILAFFSETISWYLFETKEYSGLVLITCLLIPANLLLNEQTHLYRIHRQAWRYNIFFNWQIPAQHRTGHYPGEPVEVWPNWGTISSFFQ